MAQDGAGVSLHDLLQAAGWREEARWAIPFKVTAQKLALCFSLIHWPHLSLFGETAFLAEMGSGYWEIASGLTLRGEGGFPFTAAEELQGQWVGEIKCHWLREVGGYQMESGPGRSGKEGANRVQG